MNLITAPAADLLHYAVNTSASKHHDVMHWSDLAIILGRVEDEQLYLTWSTPMASARAWASEEMGVPPGDFIGLLDLWHTMQLAYPKIQMEEWKGLSKSKARLLRKVLAAGGEPVLWLEKAKALKAGALQLEVEKKLGTEIWVTMKFPVPEELAQLVEAALVMALPAALPDEPDPNPARTKDRNVRFQCLEVIVTEYVQNNALVSATAQLATEEINNSIKEAQA